MSRTAVHPPDARERARIRRASLRFAARFAAFVVAGTWLASVARLRGPWILPEALDPFSLAWVRWYVPIALLTGALGGLLFSRMIRLPAAVGEATDEDLDTPGDDDARAR